MSKKNIEAAAKRLRKASESSITCNPIRDLINEKDIQSAYDIQAINTTLRLADGGRIVGRKIGLTSPAVQKQLGVNQPDFGMLWADSEVWNNSQISMKKLMQPKVEAEIAFILGRDLIAKDLTTADVISAIDYALASIEIVGSRIEGWNIRIADTIADNASASHFVLGHKPQKLNNLDLINCGMKLYKNGEKVSGGKGSACMGSPINAMLWLAQTMARLGKPMRAGEVVLTGALGPMVTVEDGDSIWAEIEGMGEVFVNFSE